MLSPNVENPMRSAVPLSSPPPWAVSEPAPEYEALLLCDLLQIYSIDKDQKVYVQSV